MALRVGSVGLGLEAGGLVSGWPWLARATGWTRTGLPVNGLSFAASSSALAVRQAINNRLRTGTDKGNPTV